MRSVISFLSDKAYEGIQKDTKPETGRKTDQLDIVPNALCYLEDDYGKTDDTTGGTQTVHYLRRGIPMLRQVGGQQVPQPTPTRSEESVD
jgi:hypothetical protein